MRIFKGLRTRTAAGVVAVAAAAGTVLVTAGPASALPKCDNLEYSLTLATDAYVTADTRYQEYVAQDDLVRAAAQKVLRDGYWDDMIKVTNQMSVAHCFDTP
jgi:K+/H+ antiporter YhaU regulatory subunit KhtT